MKRFVHNNVSLVFHISRYIGVFLLYVTLDADYRLAEYDAENG